MDPLGLPLLVNYGIVVLLLVWLNQRKGRAKSEYGITTVISQAGLDQLLRYKYQSSGYSWLDNIMNSWWEFTVSFVPKTIAPNVLTLTGLVCQIVSFGLSYSFAPTFTEIAPTWVYFTIFALQFTYQTLDAIDGKHARATKAGSPLGQLFDHGCDSVGTALVTLSTAMVLRMGTGKYTMVFMFIVQFPFFLAQWEEQHTHVIRTFIGLVGVTEAQCMNFGLILLTGFCGSEIWHITMYDALPGVFAALGNGNIALVDFIGKLTINYFLLGCVALMNTRLALINLSTVYAKAGATAFQDLIPVLWMFFFAFLLHDTAGWNADPALSFLVLGLLFSHLTTQMIVCNVTHMGYAVLHPVLLLMPIVTVNSYWTAISTDATEPLLGDEILLFRVFAGVVFIALLRYTIVAISQITRLLGIYCLSLDKRPTKSQ